MYSELVPLNDLSKIDSNFFYYYGDKQNSNILVYDCVEVDIESAYPTILKILFGENDPFITEMMSKESKLARNIFISTTLKERSNIEGKNYLHDLNIYSKMIVLAFVYSHWKDVTILEFKKDGCVFKGIDNDIFGETAKNFKEYINKYNINYHVDKIKKYVRFNKTSIYANETTVDIKGSFKGIPKYIKKLIIDLFINKLDPYDNQLDQLIVIYSTKFSEILFRSGLKEEFDYYYKFRETDYFSNFNSFSKNPRDTDPELLMQTVIFPLISLLRSEK